MPSTSSFSVSEDRQILVNYEEAGDPNDLLDNQYGDDIEIPNPNVLSKDNHSVDFNLIPVPADRFNFNYIVFYILGTATMAPWNFFITAEDYWMYKFRNTTTNDSIPDLTPMQKSFTSDLTVTASVSGTIFLILNAVFGHHVSLKLKMVGTMSLILLLFVVTTGFVEVDTDNWQQNFFCMTMGIVVVLNICSAVMSGGLFGIAGLFPSEFMTAVSSGQALGGIFTALAFIVALTFGASPKTTAFVYFSIGIAVILISIISYVSMTYTKYFKFHVIEKIKYLKVRPSGSIESMDGVELSPNVKTIFNKIYLYVISECLVFIVTISVYPAVTVLVHSQNFGKGYLWNDTYFLPVINYLLFNSGDYLGRILSGLIERPKNNVHLILMMTICRVLLIPLIMTSNVIPRYFLPTIIHTDLSFIGLIALLAVTNGYFANICLINVPRIVMQHEKEVASAIMVASLSTGIAIGACLSMVFVQML